jgi:hypothetical protein
MKPVIFLRNDHQHPNKEFLLIQKVFTTLENQTISNNTTSSSISGDTLKLSYIIIVVVVLVLIVALLIIYCMCFHQSINKKKIHILVKETKLESEQI